MQMWPALSRADKCSEHTIDRWQDLWCHSILQEIPVGCTPIAWSRKAKDFSGSPALTGIDDRLPFSYYIHSWSTLILFRPFPLWVVHKSFKFLGFPVSRKYSSSLMGIFFANPVPTKHTVATVSPSMITQTASSAEAIFPFFARSGVNEDNIW